MSPKKKSGAVFKRQREQNLLKLAASSRSQKNIISFLKPTQGAGLENNDSQNNTSTRSQDENMETTISSATTPPEIEDSDKENNSSDAEMEIASLSDSSDNEFIDEARKSDTFSNVTSNLNCADFKGNIDDFYPTDPVIFREISVTAELVRSLIVKGPCQPGLTDNFSSFPEERGRKFSTKWYYNDCNNKKTIRKWLVYSPRSNRLFCFYCWLMQCGSTKSSVWSDTKTGMANFKKGTEKIKLHEESASHREMQNKFIVTQLRLAKDKTVVHEQLRIEREQNKKNREILKRIVDIILFLGKQNIPLRGHIEKGDGNKGNFIELVDFLKKYDIVLTEHISQAKKNALYTSPQIQNEILNLLSEHVLKNIVKDIIKAKYFTLIVDSTIDISKKEQMSLSMRFVTEHGFVEERFLKFVSLSSASADSFYDAILNELNNFNISIALCRGQAYDGASSMSGHIKGLQTRIKENAPEAIYVHCCAHRLNLALVDSVNSCIDVKLFFGTLEQLYVFITESLPRLQIFQSVQKGYDKITTLKRLSTTRWASHTRAVNSIYENIEVLLHSLQKIIDGEISLSARQLAEANGLLNYLQTFEFLFLLCFWKEVLTKINVLSNYLQKVEINLNTAATLIKSTIQDLKNLRLDYDSFIRFESDARNIALKCNINTEYYSKRLKKIKHFHDEAPDDQKEMDPRHKFKTNIFYVALDTFIQTMTERFADFLNVSNKFVCLESDTISAADINIKGLMDLITFYESDINSNLIDEYKSFCTLFEQLKKEEILLKTDEILPYLISNNLENSFPNLVEIYKIYLTVGTNSANAERSFSRLKNIKTYNRSTMTEQRLNDIALLNIEYDYVKNLDLSVIVDQFMTMKQRRL